VRDRFLLRAGVDLSAVVFGGAKRHLWATLRAWQASQGHSRLHWQRQGVNTNVFDSGHSPSTQAQRCQRGANTWQPCLPGIRQRYASIPFEKDRTRLRLGKSTAGKPRARGRTIWEGNSECWMGSDRERAGTHLLLPALAFATSCTVHHGLARRPVLRGFRAGDGVVDVDVDVDIVGCVAAVRGVSLDAAVDVGHCTAGAGSAEEKTEVMRT
jgi:hypothetical protein